MPEEDHAATGHRPAAQLLSAGWVRQVGMHDRVRLLRIAWASSCSARGASWCVSAGVSVEVFDVGLAAARCCRHRRRGLADGQIGHRLAITGDQSIEHLHDGRLVGKPARLLSAFKRR